MRQTIHSNCYFTQAIHEETGIMCLPLQQYQDMENNLTSREQRIQEIEAQLDQLRTDKDQMTSSMAEMDEQLREKEEFIQRTQVHSCLFV